MIIVTVNYKRFSQKIQYCESIGENVPVFRRWGNSPLLLLFSIHFL